MTDKSLQDLTDPWKFSNESPSSEGFSVTHIINISPLDPQLGGATKISVPKTIRPYLFGPTHNERTPVPAWAVLDAARVPGLEDMLATSGEEHACLFRGAAFEELRDVAPWLVRLSEDNRLTRNLFTRSPASWHLWDREPGIFIRSTATLNSLLSHFRKFTRVRDNSGNWAYFRFWEPAYAAAYLTSLHEHPEKQQAWFGDGQDRLHSIIIRHGDNMTVVSRAAQAGPVQARTGFRYGEVERDAHRRASRSAFVEKLRTYICADCEGFAVKAPETQTMILNQCIDDAAQAGLRIERAVADFTWATIMIGHRLLGDPECQATLRLNMHQLDKARALTRIAKRRKESI